MKTKKTYLSLLLFIIVACPSLLADENKTIIVSKNGSGNFTSITDAINSIEKATKDNPVDIIIKAGEYFESPTTKNWVNLIGEDKEKCIVTYTRKPEQPNHKAHVMWATTNSLIKNLTLIGKDVKYCIHSDGGKGYILTVENCILKREYPPKYRGNRAAYGIGLRRKQNIIIKDCEMYADRPIFMHNWNDQKASCSMTIENCKLYGTEEAIYINCLGSKQKDFFVIHDSVLQAKKAITYTNADKPKPRQWKGESEITVIGSGNKLPEDIGHNIIDDSDNRKSGVELTKE